MRMIFGPPGTGKTTRLTGLIQSHGADNGTLGVVSFSRAAAGELAARNKGAVSYIGTAHALAFERLHLTRKQVADPKEFMDEYGDQSLVEEALAIGHISKVTGSSFLDVYSDRKPVVGYTVSAGIWEDYQHWLDSQGLLDFDDMLTEATRLPPAFDSLIVDEAQDLSFAQWQFLQAMVKDKEAVILAADDDQAIFSWAGASPEIVLEIASRPSITVEVLAQSYRIPRTIHQAAQVVVNKIGRRHPKEYKPRDEDGVVSFSGNYCPTDLGPHTVLGRHNAVLKEAEAILLDYGIPYTWQGKTIGPLDGPLCKIALAVLHKDLEVLKKNERYLSPRAKEQVKSDIVPEDWVKAIDPYRFSHNSVEFVRACGPEAVPQVRLSTIHGFKGKEADKVVLLADLPILVDESLADSKGAMDDECRVWYVGVTRAKKELHIVGSNELLHGICS